MPISATCPACRATLQVADSARGKKVRCPKCQEIFTVGSAAPNGNVSSVKPAGGRAAKPAAAKSAVTPSVARPKTAPRRNDDEDDRPPEKKKKKSMLPACLIGCGVLFLLCGGGGSIGGFFIYRGLKSAADDVKQRVDAAQSEFDRMQKEADQMQKEAENRFQEERAKAEKERQRILEEQKNKQPNNIFPPNNLKLPDNPRPPDNPLLLNNPNPPTPKPQGEVIQSVAQSIPLGVNPIEVYGVFWSGEQSKHAVVLLKSGMGKVRLEQFDLASRNKIGSTEISSDPLMGVRDLSPDGKYYVSMNPGSSYSLWALPEPKPLVDKWLPQPPKKVTPDGKENMVVSAYLLGGERLLTVNGMGQVVLWKIPDAAGQQPQQMSFYAPPASVAKYPAGMGYGLTALSPDRKRLAVYNGSDGFFLVKTDTLQYEDSVKSPEDARPATNAIFGVLGVSFSPDGKQLATMFHQQMLRRTRGTPPQLIRWDVETKQRLASLPDPSRGSGGAGSRIAWWGTEFCWLSYPNRVGSLHSWEKQSGVLRAVLGPGAKLYPGSPDGKCWFVFGGPDGKAILKGVDLPALALKAADQPLMLTPDGIVRK